MTLNVNYITDLEVKSDRTPLDRPFYNRRFKAIYDELARLDAQHASFGAAESTLIQLGLDRLNETLGPLLLTLQEAAALGFLTCRVADENHSLVMGEFVGWNVSEGAELFTPTHFLLALDETDYTNWGILSLDPDGWHSTTGELSTHVVYASKTQTSNSWQIAAHAGVLPAMEDMLTESVAARDAALASQAEVQDAVETLQDLLGTATGVISVAGKAGVVTLDIADVIGLVDALAAKASTATMTSLLAGKQSASAKLDALVNLGWVANKLLLLTGTGTVAGLDISDYAKTLLDDASGSAALSTLGISDFVKTVLDDTTAAAVRTTLGVAAAPDLPVKATPAEVATGTDDVKFATAFGIASHYLPRMATIKNTAVSYTLLAADNGSIIRFTAATAVNCTLPASVPVGFNVLIEQFGAGIVTIGVATGATRRGYGSKFRTAGQYAVASVFVEANGTGSAAEWNVSGNLIV